MKFPSDILTNRRVSHIVTPVSGTIYPLVDRILDGKLAEELKRRRERGDSLLTIVRWLDSEHGVSVSVEIVRTW